MMNITSNEPLRKRVVSEPLMKCTSSDGGTGRCSLGCSSLFCLSCAEFVREKRKRDDHGESCSTGSRGAVHNNNRRGSDDKRDAERGEESVQLKTSVLAGPKFNDFEKLREEVNFAVGQTWALYDKADGMPRLYAQIRKVSAPSFGLRITYLEPDPDDEKEIHWFEEDLPVSAGQFRLGKNENTKDRSIFSHVIQCNEGSNIGLFTVFPMKGEIWALFKNWDINWSSEPDSHRKFEYEFVEVLSDYADGTGVSVAFLHKAKGFASVFFRMGTGDADMSQILPQNLYQFSHRIPSFKITGLEGKDLPNDAYELDQAALPETIEEISVPSDLLAKLTAPKPKPEAICFPRDGKVFQTGQIWSFYGVYDDMPRYYCRIQKISLTEAFDEPPVFKIHACRLKAASFPENVIKWGNKKMPAGCGTFLATKGSLVLSPEDVSHQIVPQTSMDGNEYTILPKIGEVWVIYRNWTRNIKVHELEENYLGYDIVDVLDDALDYKVLALRPVSFANEENKTFFRAAESRPAYCCDDGDGLEEIFTIPKVKMLRFSHQIPVSRVTKEIDGELKELFEVDMKALPLSYDY